jgi:hypothetical protein
MAGRLLFGRLFGLRFRRGSFGAQLRQGNSVRKLRPDVSTILWVLEGPSLTVCGVASGMPLGITAKCLFQFFRTLPERE